MSKVEHPAHYGGDTPYEVIKVLQQWLSPTEFLGFLKGNIIKYTARANAKGGLEDHEKALWYGRRVISFIHDQRAASEPDGLATEPLFWTDLDTAETSDLDEVLALAPVCHPFLLCSSVVPHARWAVKIHDEENEPVYFITRDQAQAACAEAIEEGRRQRAEAVDQALMLAANGKLDEARNLCDDFGIDFEHEKDTGQVTVDGTPLLEADGPADVAEAN